MQIKSFRLEAFLNTFIICSEEIDRQQILHLQP